MKSAEITLTNIAGDGRKNQFLSRKFNSFQVRFKKINFKVKKNRILLMLSFYIFYLMRI